MFRVLFFIVGSVMLGIGLWQTSVGVGDLIEASRSAQWPSVPGKVLGSVVNSSNTGARRSNSRSYTPVITYSYAVNGQALTGTEITPGQLWGYASAYAAVDKFAQGTTPPIYYSPDDPKTAVLEPGLSVANFGYLLVGLLFVVFGAVGFLASWKAKPRSKSA
jgi:hypothetical protein